MPEFAQVALKDSIMALQAQVRPYVSDEVKAKIDDLAEAVGMAEPPADE